MVRFSFGSEVHHHLADRPAATTLKYTGKAVLPHFGIFRPDQVTVQMSRDYTAKRLAQGRSKGTVWTELGHLRTCLMWAKKVGLIDRAPYVERPQKPAPKDRWLTLAEIDRVLSAAAEPHIKLAALLMLTTAGRVSAILELTWDRVDFGRGQINLRLENDGPREGRPVVPINGSLRAALLQAREASISNYVSNGPANRSSPSAKAWSDWSAMQDDLRFQRMSFDTRQPFIWLSAGSP
jgi:integrase